MIWYFVVGVGSFMAGGFVGMIAAFAVFSAATLDDQSDPHQHLGI